MMSKSAVFVEPPMGAHLASMRFIDKQGLISYTHHGIYLGNGEVMHYAGFANGLERGKIERTSLIEFQAEQGFSIIESPQDEEHAKIILQRVQQREGEDLYDLKENNCEHFAYWAIHGTHLSHQVNHHTLFFNLFDKLKKVYGGYQTVHSVLIKNQHDKNKEHTLFFKTLLEKTEATKGRILIQDQYLFAEKVEKFTEKELERLFSIEQAKKALESAIAASELKEKMEKIEQEAQSKFDAQPKSHTLYQLKEAKQAHLEAIENSKKAFHDLNIKNKHHHEANVLRDHAYEDFKAQEENMKLQWGDHLYELMFKTISIGTQTLFTQLEEKTASLMDSLSQSANTLTESVSGSFEHLSKLFAQSKQKRISS